MLESNYPTSDLDWTAPTTASEQPQPVKTHAVGVSAFKSKRTDWQHIAERRLCEVIRLPYAWDGHTGRPVHPTIADYAFRLLENVLRRSGVPLPVITPLSYGGLILEWHRKGWDIEIEIESPTRLNVYAHELVSGREDTLALGHNVGPLRALIGKIAD